MYLIPNSEIKKLKAFTLAAFIGLSANAQVISQFNWNSSVTVASVGPNAISVGSSAVISSGGAGGSNGLNPGSPKMDIDMVLTGSTFNVNGIDIQIDYQREESTGNFFTRGSSLIFGGAGNLSVIYRIDNGSGGFSTVSSGNAYSIPMDNTFRTFRFYYNPGSGFGALYVNGTVVWSNDGPDNRNLYWIGAGNAVIGDQMDANGNNVAIFDNLVVSNVSIIPLPVTYLSFTANMTEDKQVQLDWSTSTETDNNFFGIERSSDGKNWITLDQVAGSGNSVQIMNYSYTDANPLKGTSVYRLRQMDLNGEFTYSSIQTVTNNSIHAVTMTAYPNPFVSSFKLDMSSEEESEMDVIVYDQFGKTVLQNRIALTEGNNETLINIENIANGIYFVSIQNDSQKQVIRVRKSSGI